MSMPHPQTGGMAVLFERTEGHIHTMSMPHPQTGGMAVLFEKHTLVGQQYRPRGRPPEAGSSSGSLRAG